jgi:hypothetical protein
VEPFGSGGSPEVLMELRRGCSAGRGVHEMERDVPNGEALGVAGSARGGARGDRECRGVAGGDRRARRSALGGADGRSQGPRCQLGVVDGRLLRAASCRARTRPAHGQCTVRLQGHGPRCSSGARWRGRFVLILAWPRLRCGHVRADAGTAEVWLWRGGSTRVGGSVGDWATVLAWRQGSQQNDADAAGIEGDAAVADVAAARRGCDRWLWRTASRQWCATRSRAARAGGAPSGSVDGAALRDDMEARTRGSRGRHHVPTALVARPRRRGSRGQGRRAAHLALDP